MEQFFLKQNKMKRIPNSIRLTEEMMERVESVMRNTPSKFRSKNHFYEISIEGYLKIQEENIRTRARKIKEEVDKDGNETRI